MKDALGHGSNSHEIIDTHNGNKVMSQHTSHRKALNATGKLEPTKDGQMPRGGWRYQIRPIAQSATMTLDHGSQDAMARDKLASGPKSAPAPIHDSMSLSDSIARGHAMRTAGDGGHVSNFGRHGYNPDSVNRAISASNRAGQKISGKQASAIHRLLKGR